MNFRDAYQNAARHIVQPNIDESSVMNEARRRKAQKRQMMQKAANFASIFVIVAIGGFSTVKAAGYLGNIIRVGEKGFVSGDVYTMSDVVPGFEENTAVYAEEEVMVEPAPTENGLPEPVNMMIEDVEEQSYNSVEEFVNACPDVVIACPKLEVSENGFEFVQVVGESVFVRYQVEEEKSLDIHRHDYSDSLGHAAAISFSGEICNERNYTTAQGFVYMLIDEVRSSEEEPLRMHAAITVEGYEVYVNFYGFEESEALAVLESIDLGIYCK